MPDQPTTPIISAQPVGVQPRPIHTIVRDYLLDHDLTVADFARLTGVPLPSLYRIMKRGSCDLVNWARITRIIGPYVPTQTRR